MINKMDIYNKASNIRKKLGFDEDMPLPDINVITSQISNLTLVLYPLGNKISGACLSNEKSAVIAINSTMSIGRQRFSFAHELYHLFYDKQMESVICSKTIDKGDETEQKADIFASYLLVPPNSLYERVQRIKEDHEYINIYDIVKLEQFYGVSRMAMLYNLKSEGFLTEEEAGKMYGNPSLIATAMGYPIDLYKPLPEKEQEMTYGYYITKGKELLDNDLISEGKYEELMLDGFRQDIVYGEIPEGGDSID